MTIVRLALIAAATSLFSLAAAAQSASPPPQAEQTSGSCASKYRPAATS